MKSILLTLAMVAVTAGQAYAQSGEGRRTATGQLTVTVTVLPASGASFRLEEGQGPKASLSQGRITMEDTQPGLVALEVWQAADGAASSAMRHGSLVVAAGVRLVATGPGNARGEVDPRVANALRAAAQRTGEYTVALAY